jgi:hypothetical protein
MKTLEFSTTIENGVIHLPKKYQAFNNVKARIVIVSEEVEVITKKARLLANFKKLQALNVFESITNPIEWQKNLRDEWS